MLKGFEVAEVVVEHIKSNYPNDIAVIAYYGSYTQGTETERSDLDFFFIPATSDGFRHSIQFTVDNISFDFWPISWERAERMASFDELNLSIIADCEILYVRCDADREQFIKLRQNISVMMQQGLKLINKAESQLHDAYIHLYNMTRYDNSQDITYYRHESQEILMSVLYCLSLINRTYLTKGWGKNLEQIGNFQLKPLRFRQLIEKIMKSSSGKEIRDASEHLVKNTLDLLLQQKETYSNGPSYSDRMKGFYEETKGVFDKILTACENGDYDTAYFFSIGVQSEIARFLYYAEKGHWPVALDSSLEYRDVYKQLGFPNLASILDARNLVSLFDAVKNLDAQLEHHLRTLGVKINQFEDIGQLERFLKQLEVN